MGTYDLTVGNGHNGPAIIAAFFLLVMVGLLLFYGRDRTFVADLVDRWRASALPVAVTLSAAAIWLLVRWFMVLQRDYLLFFPAVALIGVLLMFATFLMNMRAGD